MGYLQENTNHGAAELLAQLADFRSSTLKCDYAGLRNATCALSEPELKRTRDTRYNETAEGCVFAPHDIATRDVGYQPASDNERGSCCRNGIADPVHAAEKCTFRLRARLACTATSVALPRSCATKLLFVLTICMRIAARRCSPPQSRDFLHCG
jgi:hypothetical protein